MLISSCALYTWALWIPAGAFCVVYSSRSRITSSYLHFASLDVKNQKILLAFNLFTAALVLLPLLEFLSSDQTSLVLLACSVTQSLAWALCAILGTKECWRLPHWPSVQVNAYVYSSLVVALLQVLTVRRSASGAAQEYSQSMVAVGTAQVVLSAFLAALVSLKGALFTVAEKERLELDRVCVDVTDGRSAVVVAASGFGDHAGGTFLSPLFRRLIGGGNPEERKGRSSSGVSLKSWFGSSGQVDDDEGYAVIGHDEEEWSPDRSFSNDGYGRSSHETQSVVLSALERNQLGTGDYQPPAPVAVEDDEWSVLSGEDNSLSGPPPAAAAQSQAVKRAMQGQNARIAAAGAASFRTVLPSVRNKSRSAASTAGAPPSPWNKEGKTNAKDTDFYTLSASQWGVRRTLLDEGVDSGDSGTDGEIEFEITVKVQRAGRGEEEGSNSSWHATMPSAGAGGTSGGSPSLGNPETDLPRTKWSVWRTGAELMSLHSQLVISHGEMGVPRRLKLKSMQTKKGSSSSSSSSSGNNTGNGNRSARSKSTDRAPSPLHLLHTPNSPTKETVASQHDIAGDMRAISVYLMALLSMSNRSMNLSASGGGGSVGIPVGCTANLYPSLLSFLELYVGGSSGGAVDCTEGESREENKSRSNSLLDGNTPGFLPADADMGDESYEENDMKAEKWRKLFTKLKANVVLRDQCVRCRMFLSCIRGSDVYNFLQMTNDNFLKEAEALEMGASLVDCGLLRPVSVGYKEKQFANESACLYTFSDSSKPSSDPIDSNRFELLGGFGIDCEITDTDNAHQDGSVRYCLRLKHTGSQGVKVDKQINSSCSDRWVCWKRYSEFDNLHTVLCSHGFPPTAPLPPKTLFSGLSSLSAGAGVDPRREGLQTYLRSAIDCVMNGGEDDRDSHLGDAPRASESSSMFDGLLMLDHANNMNKGVALGEAKDALARFLDPEHESLIIV